MSLKVNNKDVQKIYFGDKEVSEVYKGNQLVYQGKPQYYCYSNGSKYWYFTELVTEIQDYDLYYSGNSGYQRAESISDLSLHGTLRPSSIIENGFVYHSHGSSNFYHTPEHDLYK